MLIAVIVACEVGFWVVLGAALITRYLLRWRRTSTVLLVCVPLLDVVLLVVSAVDLRRGTPPATGHGLAAAYLGFSVAFGPSLVRWADQRFAHYVVGGPPPWRPPRYGWARIRYEWVAFGWGLLGWALACLLLLGGTLLVDDPAPLLAWIGRLAVPMGFWLVFGPVLETVFPRRRPVADRSPGSPVRE